MHYLRLAQITSCIAAILLSCAACKTAATSVDPAATKDLTHHQGYTVFVWPKDTKKNRSYKALKEQMVQYSQYVGTLLNRSPEGESECQWANGCRHENANKVHHAKNKGVEVFCKAVAEHFANKILPTGSEMNRSKFCQYGNCGEGGQVGACLAWEYGFRPDNEIKVCVSKNDHLFALVKDTAAADGKWCLLDRWEIIGNFRCGVEWDIGNKNLKVDGVSHPHPWFNKVTCVDLDYWINS